jgi:hypothetical protein
MVSLSSEHYGAIVFPEGERTLSVDFVPSRTLTNGGSLSFLQPILEQNSMLSPDMNVDFDSKDDIQVRIQHNTTTTDQRSSIEIDQASIKDF